MNLSQRSHARYTRASRAVLFAAASLLNICFITKPPAQAQVPFAAPPTQSSDPDSSPDRSSAASPAADNSDNSAADLATSSRTSGLTAPVTLSSNQIIDILEQDPGLAVELKSQAADRLQQQGTPIASDDISDEMLYAQIENSADLRASITRFLRAGGYVSDDSLLTSAASTNDETPEDVSSKTERAPDETHLLTPPADGSGTPWRSGRREDALSAASSQSMGTAENARNSGIAGGQQEVNASTDPPKALRRPAPYNLRSMRELYTQIPEPTARLHRFGSEVFINRKPAAAREAAARTASLDVPVGPDYVVGAGDTLTIDLWGSITKSIVRAVDRDGRVFLPDAGSMQVAGLPLERAQSLIEGGLKQQYRNAQVAVTVSRVRSVRVYVVGDVQRPGGFDVSALATPLSALYAAGGPTPIGSLRTLRHYRGKQLIEEVDLYDFLLHGVRNGSAPFQSGDTLLVPPAGAQVAVSGAVKRPAIYELTAGESALTTIINDAGGFTPAASLGHIRIERIDAHNHRETVMPHIDGEQSLRTVPDVIAAFPVKDGDRILVEPILPYSERAIYLEGHVARPGRLPYIDGMHLSDVLHSYRDMLPEPAAHGEIVRLMSPDLHAETIDFSVPDVLSGNANADLQPFDTIRILGRYEADAPRVTIRGEVLRPGEYPLSKGMTAAQLVRMAGGFKRDALLESADLTSYGVVNGNRVVESLAAIQIGSAVAGTDAQADVPLKAGDVLSIHQITNWNDIGESVTINGQVRFPGSYGFQDGERLSSVLRRAGGLLPSAYPMGAVLVRAEVRELEQASREELIRQIEANSAAARLSPNLGSGNAEGTLQLIKAQQTQVLSDLKSHPPTGRMVIHITADINSWANTPADIELRRGDVLTIPKWPGFVLVTGQVYNSTALTFTPDKTAGWYLSRAGGTNSTAHRKEIFIIRANGSVVGRHSGGFFDPKVLSTKLNPGDVIVVPQKIIGPSLLWRNLLTTAQLASSIAITASIANL
jgi:protein involved in polysaccharide export with SLBB domain